MSGHIGLREEARAGRVLALRIGCLFHEAWEQRSVSAGAALRQSAAQDFEDESPRRAVGERQGTGCRWREPALGIDADQ